MGMGGMGQQQSMGNPLARGSMGMGGFNSAGRSGLMTGGAGMPMVQQLQQLMNANPYQGPTLPPGSPGGLPPSVLLPEPLGPMSGTFGGQGQMGALPGAMPFGAGSSFYANAAGGMTKPMQTTPDVYNAQPPQAMDMPPGFPPLQPPYQAPGDPRVTGGTPPFNVPGIPNSGWSPMPPGRTLISGPGQPSPLGRQGPTGTWLDDYMRQGSDYGGQPSNFTGTDPNTNRNYINGNLYAAQGNASGGNEFNNILSAYTPQMRQLGILR